MVVAPNDLLTSLATIIESPPCTFTKRWRRGVSSRPGSKFPRWSVRRHAGRLLHVSTRNPELISNERHSVPIERVKHSSSITINFQGGLRHATTGTKEPWCRDDRVRIAHRGCHPRVRHGHGSLRAPDQCPGFRRGKIIETAPQDHDGDAATPDAIALALDTILTNSDGTQERLGNNLGTASSISQLIVEAE